jgi:hypothetical protein
MLYSGWNIALKRATILGRHINMLFFFKDNLLAANTRHPIGKSSTCLDISP